MHTASSPISEGPNPIRRGETVIVPAVHSGATLTLDFVAVEFRGGGTKVTWEDVGAALKAMLVEPVQQNAWRGYDATVGLQGLGDFLWVSLKIPGPAEVKNV